MLTFGSLFAGIGGFDLGLKLAGMTCKWQVEIDPYCLKVLANHWPNVKRYEDVRDCGKHNLEPVGLVCGGFPCQPVSCAGKRKGDADERWLWPEFYRIIRETHPRWVLAENVPGLLSVDAGRLYGTVLRDLAACGYDAEWDCIPAAAVGAPHIRDRVWIVAHARGVRVDIKHWGLAGPGGGGAVFAGGNGAIRQMADALGPGCPHLQGQRTTARASGRLQPGTDGAWDVEPDVGRVADGVPARVDRLRGLGNAVVPQVVEWIGRRIVEQDG